MATIAVVRSALPRSIARIVGPGGYCSGALVAPDRVLTCAHFLRGRSTQELAVLLDGSRLPVTSSTALAGTDIALLTLARPVPAPPLEVGSAPKVGARTVTFGFGGHAPAPAARPGWYVATLPIALSRGMRTIVRPAGLVVATPPAVKGDSGGPVFVDGRVVGVQSLILDPFGVNLRLATVALLPPGFRAVTAA